MPISKEVATEIALAYREIETAEALLSEITEALNRKETPDIRDVIGRRQGGLQLGVPTGDTGHRLFNVPWRLAKPIIEAHIAEQRAIVSALSERAASETWSDVGGIRHKREMTDASDADKWRWRFPRRGKYFHHGKSVECTVDGEIMALPPGYGPWVTRGGVYAERMPDDTPAEA